MKNRNTKDSIQCTYIKITLLGRSFVGKTSLAYRFINNHFPEEHDYTLLKTYIKQVIM